MSTLSTLLTDGPVVIDGGLGTLLEARGNDLSSSLWSARMLLENPDEIRAAHAEYFNAGARVGISSSYQVSYEGLAVMGVDARETDSLLRRSVRLLREARDSASRSGLVVAASVGPYGAMLADGSEYRGDYGASVEELRDWHLPRLRTLAEAGADLLAIETIPSLAEVESIALALDGLGAEAWLAVTVARGTLRSGESMADAFAIANDVAEIVAVGVNCSDPIDITGAIRAARQETAKPIVVYPNSGERWDAVNRRWVGAAGFPSWLVDEWLDAGASLVGGCCRVGPEEIASIASMLAAHPAR
jgi:homocysteine S-methyltransferase